MPRLNPLERLYLAIHHRAYNRRLKRQVRFADKYVVSVGNLSAGGTGKTPAALFLAERVLHRNPLIVLRGYRGASSARGLLVGDGERALADFQQAGDEALLLAARRGLRVAAGADRALLIRRYGADSSVVLMDDAFQNPSVFRDHDLVLLDASVGPERMRLFPVGRFREDLAALRRANSVLLTRTDQTNAEDLAGLKRAVAEIVPESAVFESVHAVVGVFPEITMDAGQTNCAGADAEETDFAGANAGGADSAGADIGGPDFVGANAGVAIGAFCGIGNPGAFFRSVESTGLAVRERRAFPDHHVYSPAELGRLADAAAHWITTEKDLVRIADLARRSEPPAGFLERLHVLKIRLKIAHGREQAFVRAVFGDV